MIGDGLARIAKGEVFSDEWSRQVYSMDASHYEIKPALVACPKDAGDVQAICRYAFLKKVPVVGRGAGTGLLGQSLSDGGLVLDFAKHMNRVLEAGDDYVMVEPGIVKGVLDKELKKKGKFLPPDPASSNYCTIGGMIADNSSGVHCLGFGNTIDFVEALDLVYADGSTGHAGKDGFDARMEKLKNLLAPSAEAISSSYPKVSKNSCGYRLDAAIGRGFEPHKAIAASEGTLALVTSARLRVLDLPQHRFLLVLGFEDLLAAVRAVPAILESSPVALEMLDATVLALEKNAETGCLLYAEFAGDSRARVEAQMAGCRNRMTTAAGARVLEYAADEQSLARIWAARKGALGNIMKMTVGSRKPIGLVEDTVVRPEMLAAHTENLLAAYRDNKLDYVMYGHVGDGNIHTRPLVDTSSKAESEMIAALASRVFAQVIASGGTITGEHGDGLARVGYIEQMYGRKMTALFKTVKELFDPDYLLNPGKKVPFKSRRNV
ncbi:MAG: FAD-binding oxidoreductase [Nitrososphaera sp.]